MVTEIRELDCTLNPSAVADRVKCLREEYWNSTRLPVTGDDAWLTKFWVTRTNSLGL